MSKELTGRLRDLYEEMTQENITQHFVKNDLDKWLKTWKCGFDVTIRLLELEESEHKNG